MRARRAQTCLRAAGDRLLGDHQQRDAAHAALRSGALRRGALANSAIPSSKSAVALNPSTAVARSALANTWRTSPRRYWRVVTGAGAASPAASVSACASVPIERGVPEATFEGAVRGRRPRERDHVRAGDVANVDEVA